MCTRQTYSNNQHTTHVDATLLPKTWVKIIQISVVRRKPTDEVGGRTEIFSIFVAIWNRWKPTSWRFQNLFGVYRKISALKLPKFCILLRFAVDRKQLIIFFPAMIVGLSEPTIVYIFLPKRVLPLCRRRRRSSQSEAVVYLERGFTWNHQLLQ